MLSYARDNQLVGAYEGFLEVVYKIYFWKVRKSKRYCLEWYMIDSDCTITYRMKLGVGSVNSGRMRC